jgi:hypothetical protein
MRTLEEEEERPRAVWRENLSLFQYNKRIHVGLQKDSPASWYTSSTSESDPALRKSLICISCGNADLLLTESLLSDDRTLPFASLISMAYMVSCPTRTATCVPSLSACTASSSKLAWSLCDDGTGRASQQVFSLVGGANMHLEVRDPNENMRNAIFWPLQLAGVVWTSHRLQITS